MSKKPSRVLVLMMPYQDDDDRDRVGYAGPATVLTGLPRPDAHQRTTRPVKTAAD
jgi:prophage regulatory protein